MKRRVVGGWMPDEAEQMELVQLWHVSRTALSGKACSRVDRIDWLVTEFLDAHRDEPNVARKWVYCWAIDNIGIIGERS